MGTSHRLGDALEAASRPRSSDGSACLTWGVFHDSVEDANLCGDIAGVNIGAVFVGAFAGTVVIADLTGRHRAARHQRVTRSSPNGASNQRRRP